MSDFTDEQDEQTEADHAKDWEVMFRPAPETQLPLEKQLQMAEAKVRSLKRRIQQEQTHERTIKATVPEDGMYAFCVIFEHGERYFTYGATVVNGWVYTTGNGSRAMKWKDFVDWANGDGSRIVGVSMFEPVYRAGEAQNRRSYTVAHKVAHVAVFS